MNNTVKNYGGLDLFRIVAAVMVIAIHTYPFSDLSSTADFVITHVICRVAVPFFFMASGFFLISEYAKNADKLVKFIKKTAVIYAAAILIYIPVNIYNGYFADNFSLDKLFEDLIFNGTMYHLWYLPASVIGACIAWSLVRKLGFLKAIILTTVLYIFGLLGDSYFGIAEKSQALSRVYASLFNVFDYTRNGVFFAPIFFVLGGYAAKASGLKKSGRMLFILFLDLMLFEGLSLRALGYQRHDSMYIFLVPCVYFLFIVLLNISGPRKKNLGRISLVMYIIHPFVIVGVRLCAKITGSQYLFVENNLVHFVMVTVLSCVISIICVKVFPVKSKTSSLRAWKEIDLGALRENAMALKRLCPENCSLMAVVKADAYGHGAFEVATTLEKSGVRYFAAATIDEGIELRRYGIKGEILILGFTSPDRAWELGKYRLTQTVVGLEHAMALENAGVKLNVHLKIDTGMHRLGFSADDIDSIKRCFELNKLRVTGVFSHLCVSDGNDDESVAFTEKQIASFNEVLEKLGNRAGNLKVHIQSSYGLLNYGDIKCDYARVGIALYGVYSSAGDKPKANIALRPVMSIKARVAQVKSVQCGETVGYGRCFKAEEERRIAVVTIGYADGIPRNFSGNVLICGKAAPVAGRICMDQMCVDVTDIPDVKTGETVTLMGGENTAEKIANNTETITNELLSRLGTRLGTVTIE